MRSPQESRRDSAALRDAARLGQSSDPPLARRLRATAAIPRAMSLALIRRHPLRPATAGLPANFARGTIVGKFMQPYRRRRHAARPPRPRSRRAASVLRGSPHETHCLGRRRVAGRRRGRRRLARRASVRVAAVVRAPPPNRRPRSSASTRRRRPPLPAEPHARRAAQHQRLRDRQPQRRQHRHDGRRGRPLLGHAARGRGLRLRRRARPPGPHPHQLPRHRRRPESGDRRHARLEQAPTPPSSSAATRSTTSRSSRSTPRPTSCSRSRWAAPTTSASASACTPSAIPSAGTAR